MLNPCGSPRYACQHHTNTMPMRPEIHDATIAIATANRGQRTDKKGAERKQHNTDKQQVRSR